MEDPLKAIDKMGMCIRVDSASASPATTQKLQRISPEELHFAFILKCAEVVASDASEEIHHESACSYVYTFVMGDM